MWFYISALVLLTLPLCWGLFGGSLVNGHDSIAGLVRALAMEKYMGHGQFLVRWAPDVNGGYGNPMFNFYPPFFSFVSVLIYHITHQMMMAINGACVLFWVLSGIGMFLLARECWGDEGGMVSAILYLYAPYHIVDLYVRGAFAEFSSFAFFPFILLSIYKLSRKANLGFVLLGILSVFGLSLTHNIMSMLFFPVAFAFIFYLYFTEKRSSWIFYAGGIFVIGLMMSSFFWLPAFIEKKFLNLDFLISMRYDFHKSFVSLSELFWPFNKSGADRVSFQVGLMHSLLCLGSLLCLPSVFKISKSAWRMYIFFLGVGLTAVFFTLPCSQICWENIKVLSFIQFPWRILAIIVFAVSVLGGSFFLLVKRPWAKKSLMVIMGVLVVFFSMRSFPKPVFTGQQQRIEDFIALGEGEYTPKWIVVPPTKWMGQKFQVLQGNAQWGDEKMLNPVDYEVGVQVIDPSLVCFHTFYFPGWKVLVDGQTAKLDPDNPFGMILFYLPPGYHDIRVVFGLTPIRFAGMIISWAAFISLLGGIFYAF